MKNRRCRFCETPLEHTFCDLGMSPLSNSFVSADDLEKSETFFPLHAWVCSECFLVQLEQFESPKEIFSDYAYFSSYSESWLQHAERYVSAMIHRFGITQSSKVVEVASNDGYLLQYFMKRGIPVLGIEPAINVAKTAVARGIPTLVEFFGAQCATRLAHESSRANLVVANNVMAHVPDLNDFVCGLRILLASDGVATIEVPHLLNLILGNQFDTIYHEHFSYFSVLSAERIFAAHQLKIVDAEELPTHGGSLRLYVAHASSAFARSSSVEAILRREQDAGLAQIPRYHQFQDQTEKTKRRLLRFLIDAKESGKRVAAYGAAAKGNTLLNYCGIRADFVDFVADRSLQKQGRYLPGTRIPVVHPDVINEAKPDFLLVLPWNIKDEVMEQNRQINSWGGRFLIPIPSVQVL